MKRLLSYLVMAGFALGMCACDNKDSLPLPRTTAVIAGNIVPGTGPAAAGSADSHRAPAGFLSPINALRAG